MKFRTDDELLSMSVIDAELPEDDRFVFTVTDEGYAKRTPVSEYRVQGRGGLGIKAMKLNENRGELVGGLVVREADEVMAIKTSGQITRSAVAEVAVKGRDTMGVKFVGVRGEDRVARIAVNPEQSVEEVESGVADAQHADSTSEGLADKNDAQTAVESTDSDEVTHDGDRTVGTLADSPEDTAAAEETDQ